MAAAATSRPSTTPTYTAFMASRYRITDSRAIGLLGKAAVTVVSCSTRLTHMPTW